MDTKVYTVCYNGNDLTEMGDYKVCRALEEVGAEIGGLYNQIRVWGLLSEEQVDALSAHEDSFLLLPHQLSEEEITQLTEGGAVIKEYGSVRTTYDSQSPPPWQNPEWEPVGPVVIEIGRLAL